MRKSVIKYGTLLLIVVACVTWIYELRVLGLLVFVGTLFLTLLHLREERNNVQIKSKCDLEGSDLDSRK